MAQEDTLGYAVAIPIEEDKPKRRNVIPKPEGFEFTSDEGAKHGEYITVRVKDDDDGLCITEIEGMPMPGYEDEEDD